MDLALSETQQMLQQLTRELLEKEFPSTTLREVEASEEGYSRELWKRLGELGLTNVAISEAYGGAGGSLLDLGVILEEMGRGVYIGPFFATVVLGGLTLLYAASEAQKRDLLPKVGQGQVLLSLALLEEEGRYEPEAIHLQAERRAGGYVLQGTKLFVEYGHVADHLVVVARTSPPSATARGARTISGSSSDGISLFLVPRSSPGITIAPLITTGGDKQVEVQFRGVQVPESNLIGQLNQGWPAIQRVLEAATALLCMQMAGMGEKVLEITVEYVKQRVQFGRPVGSFQAVQHHAANMAILSDGAKLAAQEAVSRLAQGLPAAKEVALAKAFCGRAGFEITYNSHELNAGVGFMKESDLQFYTRQMHGMRLRFGTTMDHLKVVARESGF